MKIFKFLIGLTFWIVGFTIPGLSTMKYIGVRLMTEAINGKSDYK